MLQPLFPVPNDPDTTIKRLGLVGAKLSHDGCASVDIYCIVDPNREKENGSQRGLVPK